MFKNTMLDNLNPKKKGERIIGTFFSTKKWGCRDLNETNPSLTYTPTHHYPLTRSITDSFLFYSVSTPPPPPPPPSLPIHMRMVERSQLGLCTESVHTHTHARTLCAPSSALRWMHKNKRGEGKYLFKTA